MPAWIVYDLCCFCACACVFVCSKLVSCCVCFCWGRLRLLGNWLEIIGVGVSSDGFI